MADSKVQAQQWIDAFRARKRQGVWPRISFPAIGNAERIARDLEARVKNPDAIRQKQTNLCALVEFARAWATDDPVGYVKLVTSLFENGFGYLSRGGSASGKMIKASSDLRIQKLPGEGGNYIPFGDWVLLATLRENLNNVWGYSSDEGPGAIEAWNYPSDVVKSFKATGYTDVIDNTDWPSNQDFVNFAGAEMCYKNGYRVILLIHANMLSESTQGDWSAASNHFVGLASDIRRYGGKEDRFAFKVHTWGEVRWVPLNSWITKKDFERNYYGFIAARY